MSTLINLYIYIKQFKASMSWKNTASDAQRSHLWSPAIGFQGPPASDAAAGAWCLILAGQTSQANTLVHRHRLNLRQGLMFLLFGALCNQPEPRRAEYTETFIRHLWRFCAVHHPDSFPSPRCSVFCFAERMLAWFILVRKQRAGPCHPPETNF